MGLTHLIFPVQANILCHSICRGSQHKSSCSIACEMARESTLTSSSVHPRLPADSAGQAPPAASLTKIWAGPHNTVLATEAYGQNSSTCMKSRQANDRCSSARFVTFASAACSSSRFFMNSSREGGCTTELSLASGTSSIEQQKHSWAVVVGDWFERK